MVNAPAGSAFLLSGWGKVKDGGNLKATTYGNNQSVSCSYDDLDRLVRKEYTGGRYVTYTYNAGTNETGNLATMTTGTGDMPSVVLSKGEHRGYMNAWRGRFPYGQGNVSYSDIKNFYNSEYAGKGDWLELLAYYLN